MFRLNSGRVGMFRCLFTRSTETFDVPRSLSQRGGRLVPYLRSGDNGDIKRDARGFVETRRELNEFLRGQWRDTYVYGFCFIVRWLTSSPKKDTIPDWRSRENKLNFRRLNSEYSGTNLGAKTVITTAVVPT